MSQAEALLATLAEHTHSVADDDARFVIDVETREIASDIRRHYLMQRDHNSTRFTFELPRYVEGHDMSLCNQAKIHYNNIDEDGNENTDVCDADDLHLDGDKVICSWLISRNATQLAGSLNFLIQYQCVVDGTPVYEWHTDIYGEVVVKPGRSNSEQAVVEHADILEQWRARIFGAGDSVMSDIAAAGEAQKDAIAARAEVVLGTIPEEYTTTYNMANSARRTRANAIVAEAAGETILLNDASDDYIRGLKIFGKTTQDGAPTPDAPVELVSAGRNGGIFVRMVGINLLPTTTLEFERDYYCSLGTTYKSGQYVFSAVVTSTDTDSDKCAVMFYKDSEWIDSVFISRSGNGERVSYIKNVVSDFDTVRFYASSSYNLAANDMCTLVDMQLECGSIATEYAPYYGCDLSISVPNSLRAIPVTSGGNYTDENGQQWIADYVDFERGVYVQQIGVFTVPDEVVAVRFETYDGDGYYGWYYTGNPIRLGHNSYGNDIVSDRFVSAHTSTPQAVNLIRAWCSVGNIYYTISSDSQEDANAAIRGALVCYALATPIETPLTEEELFAFSQLHSNYPITTVMNDSGAHMAVSYNADTKLYVDGKIREAIDNYLSSHLL